MVGVLLASLLTLALLAEGGLRLAAWISLSSQARAETAQGQRTILAVGDSWTFGNESGDASQYSYPAQLQQLVDRDHGQGKYRVINRGVPGNDSAQLRQRFPELLKEFAPHVVVIQIGGLNWLGSERLGRRVVPSWLLRLSERGGWGFVAELRVVRLVGMLLASDEKKGKKRSEARLTKLRIELGGLLAAKDAVSDRRDFPELPLEGCQVEGEPRAAKLSEILAKLEPPEEQARGKDAAWRPSMASLKRLVQQRPGCAGGHVALAERYMKEKDLERARQHITAAMKILPKDLRLNLAGFHLHNQERGHWDGMTGELLNKLGKLAPGSSVVRRLRLEEELRAKCNLCVMNATLDALIRRYPGTPWMARLKQYILTQLNSDGLWAQRDRELREDLAAMVAMIREAGARVMLLNYDEKEYEGDPCSREGGQFFNAFSSAFDVPLADIKGLLISGGSSSPDDPPSEFSEGGHPNALGYGKIAKKVMDEMNAMGWFEE